MTKEEKSLLVKDLCARLPYGVVIEDTYSGHYGRLVEIGNVFVSFISELNCNTLDVQLCHVKPYLRPMSSITEEEAMKLSSLLYYDFVDYCNSHHIDYRGLIPMGLAIEAPEGMYK